MNRLSTSAGPGKDEVLTTFDNDGELKNVQLRGVSGLRQKFDALAQKRTNASDAFEKRAAESAAQRDHELSAIHEEQKSVDAEAFSLAESQIEAERVAEENRKAEERQRLEDAATAARAAAVEAAASAARTAP